MNDGRLDGKQVLDPKVITLMSTPHAAIPGGSDAYGYGLVLFDLRGVRMLGHDGSRQGYGSEIRMAPRERVAVIVQTNRSGATLPATAEKALEMLLPLGPKANEKKAKVAIGAQDVARDTGTYRNGDQQIEIIARENHLFIKRGRAPEREMIKYGDGDFGIDKQPGTFVMIPGTDGATEYVHTGLRSFARVR